MIELVRTHGQRVLDARRRRTGIGCRSHCRRRRRPSFENG